jgi:hypothetical protein
MPATTGDLQKNARGGIALRVFAVAATAFGIILYFGVDLSLPDSQDACLAAHAADHDITTQQLRSDASRQPELVAALSSCSGMAP